MARYQKQRLTYPIGSVSCGTMREEDLIPGFCWELNNLARYGRGAVTVKRRREHIKLVRQIEKRMEAEEYYESEDSGWDLEALFGALEEYAGPYFYFGSHPGDGADYGFWLSEGWDQDFDGLKVGDLSEVPAKYRGEVLHVSDHGNATLYVKTSRAIREVWSIV